MVEKSKNSINMEGGFLFCGGWNFPKSVSVGPTFIKEMRVIEPHKFSETLIYLVIQFLREIYSAILQRHFGKRRQQCRVIGTGLMGPSFS
jgi:hypothetical protein